MVRNALCPVLVRRDDQLGELEDALLAARRGESRFILLAGEAGMGKTRLVTELADEARRLGSTVLWGSCSEAELSLPYLPFVEAVGNYIGTRPDGDLVTQLGPARRELAQLFPQLGDAAPPDTGDDVQGRFRLFEAFVALLAIAAENGLLLVVEDVHWADSSTLELLDHIVRRLPALSALVLATYRTDEIHRRHRLLPSLQEWRRSRAAETVKLDPLPPEGVAEMIAAIFDSDDVGGEFSEFMHRRSEGNPFVLEEMLKEAIERGDVFRTDEGWDRKELSDLRIPDTVRDAILVRLERLSPDDVAVLQAAAVLGRAFDYATLLAVAGADAGAVHAALEAAVLQQLLEEDGEGGYRFRHALTQEAIYNDTIAPRRQQIHSVAADVLAGRPSASSVGLASHLLGAGRFAEAIPVCLRSADEAEASLAFRDSIALLERALPHSADPLERARIVTRIGRAHWQAGDVGDAVPYLVAGAAELESLGKTTEAARARLWLGRSYWERAMPERALAEFVRARDALEPEGPSAELAVAYMRIAGQHAFELDFQGCLEDAQRAVAIADEAGAGFERLWSLSFAALGLAGTGRLEEGFAAMEDVFEQAFRAGHWFIAWNVAYNELWIGTRLLQPNIEKRLGRVAELPPVGTLMRGALSLGGSYVAIGRGELERARALAARAVDEYGSTEKLDWRARVQLALALAELGRPDEATEVIPALSERSELQDVVYDAPAQVRVRLARGEVDEAVEVARGILELSPKLGIFRETLAVGAEAFVAAGLLDQAQALVDRGRTVDTDAGSALLDREQGRLLIAHGDTAGAIPFLTSAVEAADAVGYLLVALRARVLLAQAVGREGDVERAERLLDGVRAESSRVGARLIAAEAAGVAGSLGLQLAEVEPAVRRETEERELVTLGERLVTSLFADVRDSTALTAAAPPEELAERMAAFYRFTKSQVLRNHGIVDKFAGDAVMATFNVSGSRIDHCVQALRAALALRDKAPLLGLDLGVGIAVGPVVLGRGVDDGNIAVRGLSTNLAARLQAAAAGGEILLSDEAYRRVERWLAEQGLAAVREEVELSGFDGRQTAYRLASPRNGMR